MVIRLGVASMLFALVGSALAMGACGGSGDNPSLFQAQVDSGPGAAQYDGGSLFPLDAGSQDAAATCTPIAISSSFKPVWKMPATSKAGKCTAAQTSGFYDACLVSPVSAAACATFTQANGDCASCLQSDDTDTKYGVVIWHKSRAFYTLNIPGCIADAQNDLSATSCGSAYQAVLQCEESACEACGVADFSLFPSCEKKAGSECSKYLSALSTDCGGELHDANDPSAICIPSSGSSSKDVYLLLAPVFCGN